MNARPNKYVYISLVKKKIVKYNQIFCLVNFPFKKCNICVVSLTLGLYFLFNLLLGLVFSTYDDVKNARVEQVKKLVYFNFYFFLI